MCIEGLPEQKEFATQTRQGTCNTRDFIILGPSKQLHMKFFSFQDAPEHLPTEHPPTVTLPSLTFPPPSHTWRAVTPILPRCSPSRSTLFRLPPLFPAQLASVSIAWLLLCDGLHVPVPSHLALLASGCLRFCWRMSIPCSPPASPMGGIGVCWMFLPDGICLRSLL